MRTVGRRGCPSQQRVKKVTQGGVEQNGKSAYWRAFSSIFGWKCSRNGEFAINRVLSMIVF